jgi:hypothetical protein
MRDFHPYHAPILAPATGGWMKILVLFCQFERKILL